MNNIIQLTALTENTFFFALGLLGFLGLATGYVLFRDHAGALNDSDEIKKRLTTWWVIASLLIAALALGKFVGIAFFGLVSFLALKEYFSIIPTRPEDRRVLFWAYLIIPFQYYWVADAWYGVFIIFIPVYMFILIPVRMLLLGQTKGFLRAVGTIQWGVMMTVFALSHVAYLLSLPGEVNPKGGGAGLVLFLLFLVSINDVAQYIFGKKFGDKKIVPAVSPNKTWAGFLGGVGTTAILAWVLAPYLTPHPPLYAIGAGLLISIFGFFGDVTISALKRDLGLKDSSQMLPGHGGLLDRLDSLFFAGVLYFHYTWYFHY